MFYYGHRRVPILTPLRWGILKRVVAQKQTTENYLWRILQKEWMKIIARLADSIMKRCSTVFKQKGHPTQH